MTDQYIVLIMLKLPNQEINDNWITGIRQHYKVVIATSIKAVSSILLTDRPDVVIIDHKYIGMNIQEVRDYFNPQNQPKKTGLIFIYDDEDELRQYGCLGDLDIYLESYIGRCFDPVELDLRISHLLNWRNRVEKKHGSSSLSA